MFALTGIQAQAKISTTKPTIVNNQCDDLKKENESLKKSIALNTSMATDIENDIEAKVVKVIGDKKTQDIIIEVLLTNKIENCTVEVAGLYYKTVKIVTLNGDVLFSKDNRVPNNGMTTLNTDVPIKCSFVFGPLLPSEIYLKLIEVNFQLNEHRPNRPTAAKFEFYDLKIEWK